MKQDATAAAYCDFYRQIGLNPNRQPPSALNLVQRFLLAEKLTRIPLVTPVVDAANLASAETLVPIAVFDADRLACPLRLDRSLPGEQFLGFGYVEPEDLQPGTIILRDRERALSIFCYRDGQYQAVSADTRNILLIACRVTDIEIKLVETALERTKELLSQSFGVIQS